MKKALIVIISFLIVFSCSITVFAGGVDFMECPKCYGNQFDILDDKDYDICEGGPITYQCKSCKEVFTVQSGPTHDLEMLENTISCIAPGRSVEECRLCGYQRITERDALGHDLVYKDTVKPTEEKEGYFVLECTRCGLEFHDPIPAVKHVASSSGSSSGNALPAVIGGIAAAGAAAYIVMKKKKPVKSNTDTLAASTAAAGTGAAAKKLTELDLARKSVLWPEYKDLNLNSFKDFLMKHRLVKLLIVDMDADNANETFIHDCKENEPDMVLLACRDDETIDMLKERLKTILEGYEDAVFGIVAPASADESFTDALEQLKEDESILSFCKADADHYDAITSLFLPLYKPEITLEKGLDAAGAIAENFGIPGIADAIDFFMNAKDIKELLQKDRNLSNTVSIVSSISDIMGWDDVSSVTDFVSSIENAADLVSEEESRQNVLKNNEQ